MAAYPTVEAAEDISDEAEVDSEETADAADSDEPSEEEIATEEESDSEDIDEAGEEEDLSSFDVEEEDEEEVEETEEEEVVEETEEADTEDPSFSDSEDTSDTTETEAVEEEAEEEEEVVEEEVEEETEEEDSETVESEEAADSTLGGTSEPSPSTNGVALKIEAQSTGGKLYVGKATTLKITPVFGTISDIEGSGKPTVSVLENVTVNSSDEGLSSSIGEVSYGEDANGKFASVTVTPSKVVSNGTIIATCANLSYSYKKLDGGTAVKTIEGGSVTGTMTSISTDDPLAELSTTEDSKNPNINVENINVAENGSYSVALGTDGAEIGATVKALNEEAAAAIGYVEFKWIWDADGDGTGLADAAYYTYAAKDTNANSFTSSYPLASLPAIDATGKLSLEVMPYSGDMPAAAGTAGEQRANVANSAMISAAKDMTTTPIAIRGEGMIKAVTMTSDEVIYIGEESTAANVTANVTMAGTAAKNMLDGNLFDAELIPDNGAIDAQKDSNITVSIVKNDIKWVDSEGHEDTSGIIAEVPLIVNYPTSTGWTTSDVTGKPYKLRVTPIVVSGKSEAATASKKVSEAKSIKIADNYVNSEASEIKITSTQGENVAPAGGIAKIEATIKSNATKGSTKATVGPSDEVAAGSMNVTFSLGENLSTESEKISLSSVEPGSGGTGIAVNEDGSLTLAADKKGSANETTGVQEWTATAWLDLTNYDGSAISSGKIDVETKAFVGSGNEGTTFGPSKTLQGTVSVNTDTALRSMKLSFVNNDKEVYARSDSNVGDGDQVDYTTLHAEITPQASAEIDGTVYFGYLWDEESTNHGIVSDKGSATKYSEYEDVTEVPASDATAIPVWVATTLKDGKYTADVKLAAKTADTIKGNIIGYAAVAANETAIAGINNSTAMLKGESSEEISVVENPISTVSFTMPYLALGSSDQNAKITIDPSENFENKISAWEITQLSSTDKSTINTSSSDFKCVWIGTDTESEYVYTVPMTALAATAAAGENINFSVQAMTADKKPIGYAIKGSNVNYKVLSGNVIKSVQQKDGENTSVYSDEGAAREAMTIRVNLDSSLLSSSDVDNIKLTWKWDGSNAPALYESLTDTSAEDGTTGITINNVKNISGSYIDRIFYVDASGLKAATSGKFEFTATPYKDSTHTSDSSTAVEGKSSTITVNLNPIRSVLVNAGSLVDSKGNALTALTIGGDPGYIQVKAEVDPSLITPGTTPVLKTGSVDLSLAVDEDSASSLTASLNKELGIQKDGENYYYVAEYTLTPGSVAEDDVSLGAAAVYKVNNVNVGHIMVNDSESASDSHTVDVKSNFLTKIKSLTIAPNSTSTAEDSSTNVIIGGKNAIATAKIQGVQLTKTAMDSLITGNRAVEVTWVVKDSSGETISDDKIKLRSVSGSGSSITYGAETADTLKTYLSSSDYADGVWTARVAVSGYEADTAGSFLSISGVQVVADKTTNPTVAASGLDYDNVSIFSLSDKEASSKNGCAKILVEDPFGDDVLDFTEGESDIASGIVKDEEKTLKTKVTLKNISYDVAAAQKWDYVRLIYTWKGSTTDKIIVTSDNISETDFDSVRMDGTELDATNGSQDDAELWIPYSAFESTNNTLVFTDTVKIKGSSTAHTGTIPGKLVVSAQVVKNTGTSGSPSATGKFGPTDDPELYIQKSGKDADIYVRDVWTQDQILPTGTASVVVGTSYTLRADILVNSPNVTDVKVQWDYADGTTDANKIFGDKSTWTNEGEVTLNPLDGGIYAASLPLEAVATGTATMKATLSYKYKGTAETPVDLTDVGTITATSAISSMVVTKAVDNTTVGDTIEFTATATTATGLSNVDHVDIAWPVGDASTIVWAGEGKPGKDANGDPAYIVTATKSGNQYVAKASYTLASADEVSLQARATAYRKVEVEGVETLVALEEVCRVNSPALTFTPNANAIESFQVLDGTDSILEVEDAETYYLWYNGKEGKDITVKVKPTTGFSGGTVNAVNIVPTWTPASGSTGTVGFYAINADETTGAAITNLTITNKETSGDDDGKYVETFRIIGSGGKAEGVISFKYGAYSSTPISDTGKLGNLETRKTVNISVRENPISTTTAIPVLDSAEIGKGETTVLNWEIKTPYAPTDKEAPAKIKVKLVASDTAITFPDATEKSIGTATANDTVVLDKDDYVASKKAYVLSTHVKMDANANTSTVTGEHITTTATAYDSDDAVMGYKLEKETAKTIKAVASTSDIKDVTVAYDSTNGRVLTLGSNGTNGFGGKPGYTTTELTATVTAATAATLNNTKVSFTWSGSTDSITVKQYNFTRNVWEEITATNKEYVVDTLTNRKGTGPYTGDAVIQITANSKDAGSFEVKAYDTTTTANTKTVDSPQLSILDWLKSASVSYIRTDAISDTEWGEKGDVIKVKSGRVITMKALVVPNDGVIANNIGALRADWTWNGTTVPNAVALDSDHKEWKSALTNPVINETRTGFEMVYTFLTNQKYDGTNGTFTVDVQGYTSSSSTDPKFYAGEKVSAITSNRIEIETNALQSVSLDKVAGIEKFSVGADDGKSDKYNLQAVIEKGAGIDDISKIVIKWSAESEGVTSAVTIRPEGTDKTAGAFGTVDTIENPSWDATTNAITAKALLASDGVYYKKKITVSAQAYKKVNNKDVIYGDELEKTYTVSILGDRTLSVKNRYGAEVEDDTIDVVAGRSVVIKTTAATSDDEYQLAGSEGDIANGIFSAELSEAMTGISLANNTNNITISTSEALKSYGERTLKISVKSDSGYNASSKEVKLRIWPYIESKNLSMTPSEKTVDSSQNTTFTISASEGLDIYPDATKIEWTVLKGSTVSTATEDTGADIATITPNGTDPRMAVLSVQKTNTYNGPIIVRAVVNEPVVGDGKATVYSTGINVKAVLSSIGVKTKYQSTQTLHVNRTKAWGTNDSTADSFDTEIPITITPSVTVDKFNISYSQSGIAEVVKVYEDSNNKPTGAFMVKGLKAGVTTIRIQAELDGVKSNTVGIPVEVKNDEIEVELSTTSLTTFTGGTINLNNTKILGKKATLKSKQKFSQASSVTYKYETKSEDIKIEDGVLTGINKCSDAVVKVTPVLEGYEGNETELKVSVKEALSEDMAINPSNYTMRAAKYGPNTAAGEDPYNTKQFSVKANTTSNVTWKWSSDHEDNINFDDATKEKPIVSVIKAFDGDDKVVITLVARQTISNVVDNVNGVASTDVVVERTATMTLNISEKAVDLVSETGVSFDREQVILSTANANPRAVAANIETAGARGVSYNWSVLAADQETTSTYLTLVTYGEDGTTASNNSSTATNATVALNTAGRNLTEETTAYLKVVATQAAASTSGGSANIVATKIIPVHIYPAKADAITVYASDGTTKKVYGGDEQLVVGSTYTLGWKLGSEVGTKPAGYELETKKEISTYLNDDSKEVDDTTEYVKLGDIDENGNGTIEAMTYSPAKDIRWKEDKGAITITYTWSCKDEDGNVLHKNSGTTKFKVKDKEISTLTIDRGEQIRIEPNTTETLVATQSGGTNVEYSWKLERSEDGGKTFSDMGTADTFIAMVGSSETARLNLSGLQSTDDYLYRATVKAENTAGSKTQSILVRVKSDKVYVTGMSVAVDGETWNGLSTCLLDNGADSEAKLKATLIPDQPSDSTVIWSVNNAGVALFKKGNEKVNMLTADAGETVTLVPGGTDGSVIVTVSPVGASGASVVENIPFSVREVPLQGVRIGIKNFTDKYSNEDTINPSDTTELVAVPVPSTAALGKVTWKIAPANGSSPKGGAVISSEEGNSTTVTGILGKTGGSNNYTVTAKVYETYNGEDVEVGSDTFTIKVTDDDIAISDVYLDKTSAVVDAGSEDIELTAEVLPSGASTDNLRWEVVNAQSLAPDTTETIAKISNTAGKTTKVTPVGAGDERYIAAYDKKYTNYQEAANAYAAGVFSLKVNAVYADSIQYSVVGAENGAYVFNTDPSTKASFAVVKAGEKLTIKGSAVNKSGKDATDKLVSWTATGTTSGTLELTANDDKTEYTMTAPATSQVVILKGTSADGYAKTPDIELDIKPALTASNFTAAIPDGKYTGAAYVPAVSGTYRGIEVSGSDIKVETDVDPINAGDKTLKISAGANGKYTIATPIEKSYKINPITMSDASVKLSVGSYNATYDGKAKTPAVSATISGNAYTPAKVTYSNNINAGTATAKVDGDGKNVTGSKNVTFPINKAASSFTVGNITLTGAKAATISPKNGNGVKSYTYALTSGKSYVTLSGNKLTGKLVGKNKAKVRVTGVGDANHNNSVKDITITVNKPAKVTNVKPATTKKHIVQAKWKKSTSATGYVVQLSTSKKFTKKTTKTVTVKKASTVKYNFKKCTKGKRYYTRVYAYVGNNKTANRSKVSAKKYVVCK